MLSVWIGGGLGNQLFQYVFMRHLQELKFPDVCIGKHWFDYGEKLYDAYGNATVREFTLDRFMTKYREMSREDIEKCELSICEDENYNDLVLFGKNAYVLGYWQNIDYLHYVEDAIKQECCLKPEYITNEMKETQKQMEECLSVSVHVRRGDYLNEDNIRVFSTCDLNYYERAVTYIKQITGEEPVLYMFSDDPEWVIENMHDFCGCKTIFVRSEADYQELHLMHYTKHNIIANSTFSWWGAYLNVHADAVTIAPEMWYRNRPRPNIYFNDWVIL